MHPCELTLFQAQDNRENWDTEFQVWALGCLLDSRFLPSPKTCTLHWLETLNHLLFWVNGDGLDDFSLSAHYMTFSRRRAVQNMQVESRVVSKVGALGVHATILVWDGSVHTAILSVRRRERLCCQLPNKDWDTGSRWPQHVSLSFFILLLWL